MSQMTETASPHNNAGQVFGKALYADYHQDNNTMTSNNQHTNNTVTPQQEGNLQIPTSLGSRD
jgi:hypothetical protein